MQLLLEPGAQTLGKHRRGARGADCDRHLAAIDDRRQREGAKLRAIGNVDRDAERAGDSRDARILLVVFGRGDDERPPAQLIDAGKRADKRHLTRLGERGKLGNHLLRGNVDNGRALQKKPRLDGRQLTAADDERWLALEAHEDGKGAHRLASHHQPLLRRVGQALRRKLDLEPIELLRHDDLAAEP